MTTTTVAKTWKALRPILVTHGSNLAIHVAIHGAIAITRLQRCGARHLAALASWAATETAAQAEHLESWLEEATIYMAETET